VNRTELKAAIESRLLRGTGLSITDELIELAEGRLFRECRRLKEFQGTDSITSAASIGLPADCDAVRAVELVVQGVKVIPAYVSLEDFLAEHDDDATEPPAMYTISDEKLMFWPTGGYSGTLHYWKKPEGLSASVSTNPILDRAPDLYVAAAVAEGFLHYRAFDLHAQYVQITTALIASLNGSAAQDSEPQEQTIGGRF
jgi:hypothetical protein